MNSLSSGIGPEENLIYETQGINFQNISQAKSKKLGKDLYLLMAKKKTRPAVFVVFFLELYTLFFKNLSSNLSTQMFLAHTPFWVLKCS